MIVADSDVLIDALRGRSPYRGRIAEALENEELATTIVSLFELLSGARTDQEAHKVENLLAGMRLLGLDEEAGRAAAEIRRELEKKGMPIGMADYLIAGICLSRSAALLTRNRSHFARVPGLLLIDLETSPEG